MKKTNFLKGLAMAAIALVSVFTTSCSEEELSIKGANVTIPEAAPAKVQLAISVVDLQNSKTLAQTIEDVTGKMGTTYSVACPAFAEKSQYTTTKNIEVQVPTIEKGQAVIIPVTFYVVSLNSALKDAMEDSEVVADENAEVINRAVGEYGIEISTFWCGWSGPSVWNFYEGPLTLGLVPVTYRHQRIEELKKGSDFVKKINVENLATHVGFIPENPATTEYMSLVCSLKELAGYVKNNGQYFLFETGQETPVTLRRTIEDIGGDNLGIFVLS